MGFRLFLIIVVFFAVPFTGATEERTAKSIIEEMKKRHSSDNEFNEIAMTLVDRKGLESRQLVRVRYSKNAGEDNPRYLTSVQYLSPENISGVELLTQGRENGKADGQWMYLPADRSYKRITGSSKTHRFMGTDIDFGDIRLENLVAGHEYTLLGKDSILGRESWKIAIACFGFNTNSWDAGPYGKLIMWVDQTHYYPLKVEFYNTNSRHVKTALFEDIRPVKGKLYRSHKMTWKRIRQKTSTVLLCRKIEIGVPNKEMKHPL